MFSRRALRLRPPDRCWRRRLGVAALVFAAAALVKPLWVLAASRQQIAVFRRTTGEWFVRVDESSFSRIPFGAAGDIPVARDYEGRGQMNLAVFRPSTQEWLIRTSTGATASAVFGGPDDQPIPGDYLGLGRAQIAVFRPSTREWLIRRDDGSAVTIPFGGPDDIPVPADYLGSGRDQIAIFRKTTQEWFIRKDNGEFDRVQWGGPGDVPAPADYLSLRHAQVTIYRPSTGEWFIRDDQGGFARAQFGGPTDQPKPGDYDGIGRARIAVFRPETGEWFIRNDDGSAVRVSFGGPDDVPVPAAYGIAASPPPPPLPPAAPSNLAAAASSQSQITLTWKDNSSDETGFKIERRTGSGSFAEIASVGANVTTYPDTGLTAGTSYGYRVRAAGAGGNSGYSNEATATTQSAPPALTLAKDVQPIFTANCALSGCHVGSFPQQGLDLSAGKAFNSSVNVNSSEAPDKKRVKPGDPDNSFLFEKVSKNSPSVGVRMPDGRASLSQAEINKIRDWIAQGANP